VRADTDETSSASTSHAAVQMSKQ